MSFISRLSFQLHTVFFFRRIECLASGFQGVTLFCQMIWFRKRVTRISRTDNRGQCQVQILAHFIMPINKDYISPFHVRTIIDAADRLSCCIMNHFRKTLRLWPQGSFDHGKKSTKEPMAIIRIANLNLIELYRPKGQVTLVTCSTLNKKKIETQLACS